MANKWKNIAILLSICCLFEFGYIIFLQRDASFTEIGTILPNEMQNNKMGNGRSPGFAALENQLGNKDTELGTIIPPKLPIKQQGNEVISNEKSNYNNNNNNEEEGEATVALVFGLTFLSAIISGVGALPFFFITDLNNYYLGICNAIAAGLMLSASFSLAFEGISYSIISVVIGIACGVVFIIVSSKWLEQYEHLKLGNLKGVNAKKVLLIMGVMTLHSFAEGVGMGMSFGGGKVLGFFITLAIAIHNIPEGLAISLVMVPNGLSPTSSLLWAAFSSLPQPLMAVPAFLFVEVFEAVLPWGLGFAAGAMTWMVFSELIPEAFEEVKSYRKVAITCATSLLMMTSFQYFVLEKWLEA